MVKNIKTEHFYKKCYLNVVKSFRKSFKLKEATLKLDFMKKFLTMRVLGHWSR